MARRRPDTRQMSLLFDPSEPPPPVDSPLALPRAQQGPQPWDAWFYLALPPSQGCGPHQRLADLTVQIKRDLAIIAEGNGWDDDGFFSGRVAKYRTAACKLLEEINGGLETEH